ncbi:hypothetical protein MCOR25_004062 [Pyricularia grisea]|uniref:PHD-type domain-containing protein n=1 Tax=Pyricularia grisea TaxID=148305 RepID=A0A6P8ATT0_PYRGI|nr:uncharacterized protein PgNI_09523 [Pyricularia grisea]KAI6370929.1 hypothetical protein MCOR25_004062 [Pyricularia grisea]TLD05513.1 hypothetical protein PgNI_09523 [Pyricularia grisea]
MTAERLDTSFGNRQAWSPSAPSSHGTPTAALLPSPIFEALDDHQSSGGYCAPHLEDVSPLDATFEHIGGDSSPRHLDSGGLGGRESLAQIPGQGAVHSRKRARLASGFRTSLSDPPALQPLSEPSNRLTLPHPNGDDTIPRPEEPPLKRARKVRRRDAGPADQGQTITPPSSTHKRTSRQKPTPKIDNEIETMQDAQGFHDFPGTGAPDPNDMPVFVTSPGDMFAYPLSAPTSASLFPDPNMWNNGGGFSGLGLDIDFGAAGSGMLQGHHALSPTQHLSMDPSGWDATAQMFQDSSVQAQDVQLGQNQPDMQHTHPQPQPQPQQQRSVSRSQSKQQRPTKRERPIAPKTTTSSADISFTAVSASLDQVSLGLDSTELYQGSFDDPYCLSHTGESVNPGLLLSRPPSVNMDGPSHRVQPQSRVPLSSASSGMLQSSSHAQNFGISKASMREMAPARPVSSRANTVIPPAKTSVARPAVSRSFSEHRSQKRTGRASGTNKMPVLAPATQRPLQPPPQLQPQQPPQRPRSRPSSTGSMRSSGRSSPFKDHHHSRLSSLNSIPEASPQPQLAFRPTLARITVNADGHASVEEVFPSRRTRSARSGRSSRSADDEYEEYASSTDDEEIVIPAKCSRPRSFALPDSLEVSGSRPRWQEAGGRLLPHEISLQNDEESEAETVINDGAGDAESELRRLRQRQMANHGSPKKLKISATRSFSGHHSHPALLSPATMTEMSLPTPSSRNRVRCVCAGSPGGEQTVDGLMVQCQSCEMWLHGKCINVSKRNMPSVYICSFCAETPRNRRNVALGASSPLAHKSFTKFR